MKNNSKYKKSLFKKLKILQIVLIIFLITTFFGIYRIFKLVNDVRQDYLVIKEVYSLIDNAMIDYSKIEDLIGIMKKYNYNPTKFVDGLKLNNLDKVIQELENFKKYMQNYEFELLNFRYEYFIKFLIIFFISEILIFILFYEARKSVIFIGRKLFSILQTVIEKLYIDKIPLISNFKYTEEDKINQIIKSANLRYDLLEYFRSLPYVDTIEDYINLVGEHLCSFFDAGRFSIALILEDEIIAEAAYFLESEHTPLLKRGFRQKLSETSLNEMIKNRTKYRIIGDLRNRKNSESSYLIVKEGFLSNLTVPVVVNGKIIGFFFLASKKVNGFTESDGKLFYMISQILSPKLYYTLAIQKIISNFGNSLVKLSEYRDNETGNHIKRVALYSKTIAKELKLEPKLVREIYQFAPLHDIGKVGIPDNILLKPGKLEDYEWEIMKKHVVIGIKILEDFEEKSKDIITEKALRTAINIISDHHEKWDGSGYPFGKKREEISIEGRIVAVADVFDALTTSRPYKKAFSFEKSLSIIKEESGKHFDPVVVQAFINSIDKIRKIYEEFKDSENNF